MDNSDLKKLSRLELLEILLEQSKRIEELEEQIDKLNDDMNSKKLRMTETGTLAEASLKLTEIFKAADEAANIYMNNVMEKAKKEEKQMRKECREYKQKKFDEIDKKCQKREEQAEKKLIAIEEKIKKVEEDQKLSKKVSQSKAKTGKRKFKK